MTKIDLGNFVKGAASVFIGLENMVKALQSTQDVLGKINQAIMAEPLDFRFYSSMGEVKGASLKAALSQYRWPEDHVFIHVRPPQALNIPDDYYVGQAVQGVKFDTKDLGDVYWYDTSFANQVNKGFVVTNRKKGFKTKKYVSWSPCDVFRFVLDLGGTNFPIGAFVRRDRDWTDVIDFTEFNAAQFATALDNAGNDKQSYDVLSSFTSKIKVQAKFPEKAPSSLSELLSEVDDED